MATRRILFITANRIGDAVLSTGALQHLADSEPDAAITIVCGPLAEPLFRAAPNLENLIVLRKRRFRTHWPLLWLSCVRRRWHRVVDLRGSATSWLVRTGQRNVDRGRMPGLHRVQEVGVVMGLDAPPVPRLWIADSDRDAARALLPDEGPLICLAPTANWTGKEWPLDRFLELVRHLTGTGGPLAGATVLIAGAPDERARVQPLIDALPAGALRDLYGQPLNVAAAAIARAGLFVGNDSGLMHLAAASGVPTLGLFGPSPAHRYAPWGPAAAHVTADPSGEEAAIADLSLERVIEAAEALLARHGGRRAAPAPKSSPPLRGRKQNRGVGRAKRG